MKNNDELKSYDELVNHLRSVVTKDELRDPRVRNLIRTAADHAFALSAGNRHRATHLLGVYERMVAKLGYDPLDR